MTAVTGPVRLHLGLVALLAAARPGAVVAWFRTRAAAR
jgi:hypothetical protein